MWFAYAVWTWIVVTAFVKYSQGGKLALANFLVVAVIMGGVIHLICHLITNKNVTKKQPNSDKDTDSFSKVKNDFISEFNNLIDAISYIDKESKLEVSVGINFVLHNFFSKYHKPENFYLLSIDEKKAYIDDLTEKEIKWEQEYGTWSAAGFGLSKMWIGTISEGDVDLAEDFYSKIRPLSLLMKEKNDEDVNYDIPAILRKTDSSNTI